LADSASEAGLAHWTYNALSGKVGTSVLSHK
jgi:hypothetical protein